MVGPLFWARLRLHMFWLKSFLWRKMAFFHPTFAPVHSKLQTQGKLFLPRVPGGLARIDIPPPPPTRQAESQSVRSCGKPRSAAVAGRRLPEGRRGHCGTPPNGFPFLASLFEPGKQRYPQRMPAQFGTHGLLKEGFGLQRWIQAPDSPVEPMPDS